MWFLTVLSWLSNATLVVFLTLCVAAGLFYLAELVEEHTAITARVIKYMILSVTGVYIGLALFESLPRTLIAAGLLAQALHYRLLKNFPYFELLSPSFIASVVVLVFNHYLAFSYFSDEWHPFPEVLGFFTIGLWLVPFAFFISLSANENVLPSTVERKSLLTDDGADIVSSYFNRKGKKYGLLTAMKHVQEMVFGRNKKTF